MPYLDGVNMVTLAEDSTRVQSLIGGSEDLVDNITGADVKLLQAQPGVQTLQIKAGGWVDLAAWGEHQAVQRPGRGQGHEVRGRPDKIMRWWRRTPTDGPDIPVPQPTRSTRRA